MNSNINTSKLINYPRVVEINQIQIENPKVKTFIVYEQEIAELAKPGQFLMVWVIGSDEIPISISKCDSETGEIWLTVARVGETTEHLHNLEEGDQIGLRGPYGNSFNICRGNFLIIGGGYGIAPLSFAAEELSKHDAVLTIIIGAKTRNDLIFLDRLNQIPHVQLHVTTDDGSFGYKGTTIDKLTEILTHDISFSACLLCGPEIMIKKAWMLCRKYSIPVEASLERYMKCGFGICGSCMLGPYRVCKDGPIFNDSMLEQVENEFGVFKRNSSGKRHPI